MILYGYQGLSVSKPSAALALYSCVLLDICLSSLPQFYEPEKL